MKQTTIAILMLGLVWGTPASSHARDEGRELFRTKCGQCHAPNQDHAVVNPVDKASIQWNRFFLRNKHRHFQDLRSLISEKDLVLIADYLKKHASDSDYPEVAGEL